LEGEGRGKNTHGRVERRGERKKKWFPSDEKKEAHRCPLVKGERNWKQKGNTKKTEKGGKTLSSPSREEKEEGQWDSIFDKKGGRGREGTRQILQKKRRGWKGSSEGGGKGADLSGKKRGGEKGGGVFVVRGKKSNVCSTEKDNPERKKKSVRVHFPREKKRRGSSIFTKEEKHLPPGRGRGGVRKARPAGKETVNSMREKSGLGKVRQKTLHGGGKKGGGHFGRGRKKKKGVTKVVNGKEEGASPQAEKSETGRQLG